MILVYQDFKYRAVYWILFPILAFLLVLAEAIDGKVYLLASNFGINLLYLIIVYSLVTIYFSFKRRKLINLAHNLIGAGDLLFFLIVAMCFSPVNFILFFNVSLVSVFLLVLILPRLSNSIPLAGLQGVLLILIGILSQMYNLPMNEEWLLYFMQQ
ncbi:hypothetical protein RCC89_05085 [Cytophagaceae bacterium ABcell3]|nr:hypothetical protein RCC89_05085 [Cytophagaceae bacterium ABcell3]